MVDSDSSEEMLGYPSFEGDACIPLFFCFLFENQLLNLIQVNVIFSLTITGNRLKLQKKLTQKPKSKDIARTICGYQKLGVEVEIPTMHKRGHSKMTSPQKCQILDPPPPYVTVSHFYHYNPSPPCHQANSDKLFPRSNTLIILHIL